MIDEDSFSTIEALIRDLEGLADVRARETARSTVRAVLELHRAGMARVMDLVGHAGTSHELLARLANDPLVGSLLALHDLHPHSLVERVQESLAGVMPDVTSKGFEARLESVTADRVEIVLTRRRESRGAESEVHRLVEQAIARAAPEVAVVEVVDAPRDFVPLEALTRRPRETRA